MAKIFYSMAGEGRGHAVRVMTLVEHLRQQHELVLFAPGDAHEFLEKAYGAGQFESVRLVPVAGWVHSSVSLAGSKRSCQALRF